MASEQATIQNKLEFVASGQAIIRNHQEAMASEQAIIRTQQEGTASEQARQHHTQTFILSRQTALASSPSCRIDDPESWTGYVSKEKESSSAATNPENHTEVLNVRSTLELNELRPPLSDVEEELVIMWAY